MTDPALLGSVTRGADGQPVVVFDREYDTDPADLWAAVTDADRVARWFAPVEGDLEVGGRFTIRFDDGDIPGCRLTACDPPRSFAWEWPHGEQASLVTVEVTPAGGRARLRLAHTRCRVATAPAYAAGWQVYVRRLEEHLAGRAVGDTWFEEWAARDGYAAALAEGARATG